MKSLTFFLQKNSHILKSPINTSNTIHKSPKQIKSFFLNSLFSEANLRVKVNSFFMIKRQITLSPISELPIPEECSKLFEQGKLFMPSFVLKENSPSISSNPNPLSKPGKQHKVGKGPWTTTEDKLLLDSMASFSGHICWEELSKRIPGRSAKQCRERWQFRLHPDVNKAPFEPWEDELIINERVNMGNHWTQIAAKLPGRTSCSVKNRWYTVLRHRRPDQTARRAKILSIQTTPFYLETVMLRDRRELWERNTDACSHKNTV